MGPPVRKSLRIGHGRCRVRTSDLLLVRRERGERSSGRSSAWLSGTRRAPHLATNVTDDGDLRPIPAGLGTRVGPVPKRCRSSGGLLGLIVGVIVDSTLAPRLG
jgi:hypothetical protein